jgi:hypothetical protein
VVHAIEACFLKKKDVLGVLLRHDTYLRVDALASCSGMLSADPTQVQGDDPVVGDVAMVGEVGVGYGGWCAGVWCLLARPATVAVCLRARVSRWGRVLVE